MLLLHLLVGGLLLRQPMRLPPADKRVHRTELRLLRPALPPPRATRAPEPPRPEARPRLERPAPAAETRPVMPQTPGPNAITLPTPAPAAPAPMASAPLDLRLPGRGPVTGPGTGVAELMRHDPRTNSPRESAQERLARAVGGAMGNGETTVIEDVQGGRMIRGPNGECSLIRPSMMQEIDPTNDRHRMLPGKVSDCSQLEPGARRHKRPGSR